MSSDPVLNWTQRAPAYSHILLLYDFMQTNKIIKDQEKKHWIRQMCKQTGEKYWLLHCNLVCNVEYGLNIFVLLHLQAVLLINKLVFVFAALMKHSTLSDWQTWKSWRTGLHFLKGFFSLKVWGLKHGVKNKSPIKVCLITFKLPLRI